MPKTCFMYAMLLVLGYGSAYGQSKPSSQSAPPGVTVYHPGTAAGADAIVSAKGPTFTSPPLMASTPAQYRLSLVQWYMTFESPLQLGAGRLAGMGDEAAFDIYTLMVNSPPMTAAQTLTALDIIHKSFANPIAILNGQTKPVSSLALLKMFQATAVDQAVKERIATETTFLNAVPEKIVQPPPAVHPPPPPGVPIGLF